MPAPRSPSSQRSRMETWVCAGKSEALENRQDLRTTEPLLAALKDQDLEVRKATFEWLGNLKDVHAASVLIAGRSKMRTGMCALKSPRHGRLGDPSAVEPLIAVLKDQDLRRGSSCQGVGEDW